MSLSENVIKEYRINLIKIILSDEFSNLYFCYKKTKNIKKYYELLNYIKQNLICNNVDNIEHTFQTDHIELVNFNIKSIKNSNKVFCNFKLFFSHPV